MMKYIFLIAQCCFFLSLSAQTFSVSSFPSPHYLVNEYGNRADSMGFEDIYQSMHGYYIGTRLKLGIRRKSGEQLLPEEFDNIEWQNGYFHVKKAGKQGVYAANGKCLISVRFDDVAYWSFYGHFRVLLGDKMGFYDTLGQELVPPVFEQTNIVLSKDYFLLKKDGKLGIFDSIGKEVVAFEYDKFHKVDGGFAGKKGGQWILFDSLFHEVNTTAPTGMWAGLFFQKNGENWEFKNALGKTKYSIVCDTFWNGGQYGVLKKQGKYGLMWPNGEMLLPCIYDTIEWGKFRQVIAKKDGFFHFLDGFGVSTDVIKADSLVDMGSGFFRAVREEEVYFINQMSATEVNVDFDKIVYSECKNLLYLVHGDSAYLVTKEAEKLLSEAVDAPNENDYYSESMHIGNYPFAIVSKNGKKGLFDAFGRQVLPFEFDEIDRHWLHGNYLRVGKDGKYGVFDFESEQCSAIEFDYISETKFGLFYVSKSGKVGLLNTGLELVLPIDFDNVSPSLRGFVLNNNDKYGMADTMGIYRINTEYLSVRDLQELLWVVGSQGNENYDFFDQTWQKSFSLECTEIRPTGFSGYNYVVFDYNIQCLIDSTGKILFRSKDKQSVIMVTNDKVILSKNGAEYLLFLDSSRVMETAYAGIYPVQDLLVVKEGNGFEKSYFLMDLEGQKISDQTYDKCIWDGRSDYIIALKEGKYGFLDKQGREVYPFELGFAEKAHPRDRYAVRKNGKWGYLNVQLKWVISPQFDYADTFYASRAQAVVLMDGRYQWIDTLGRIVRNFDYSQKDEVFQRKLRIGSPSNANESDQQPLVNLYSGQHVLTMGEDLIHIGERGLFSFSANPNGSTAEYHVGLKNLANQVVIEPFCHSISLHDFNYRDFAVFYKNGKYGVVSLDGRILIEPKYDQIYYDDKVKQCKVQLEGKVFYIPFSD